MRFNLDPTVSKDIKTFRSHIRYSLFKDEGSRVLILLDVAGKYVVEEYGFQQKIDGNNSEVTKEIDIPYAGDDTRTISMNIYVVLERRNAAANALFALDSVDIWGITGKEEYPK